MVEAERVEKKREWYCYWFSILYIFIYIYVLYLFLLCPPFLIPPPSSDSLSLLGVSPD